MARPHINLIFLLLSRTRSVGLFKVCCKAFCAPWRNKDGCVEVIAAVTLTSNSTDDCLIINDFCSNLKKVRLVIATWELTWSVKWHPSLKDGLRLIVVALGLKLFGGERRTNFLDQGIKTALPKPVNKINCLSQAIALNCPANELFPVVMSAIK